MNFMIQNNNAGTVTGPPGGGMLTEVGRRIKRRRWAVAARKLSGPALRRRACAGPAAGPVAIQWTAALASATHLSKRAWCARIQPLTCFSMSAGLLAPSCMALFWALMSATGSFML